MSNVDKTVKNLFDTQLTKTGLSTFYVEKTLKIFLNLLTGIYYCGVMSAVKFVSYLLH